MSDDVTSRVCHDLRPTESEESDESTSRADFRAGACLTSPRVYRPVTSSYSLLTHLLTALQERSTHVMSTEKKSIKKIYDQTRRLFVKKKKTTRPTSVVYHNTLSLRAFRRRGHGVLR